jgi:hypothetical protein
MTAPMLRRRDAAQATVKRFEGRKFKWSTNDCVRLAAFTLRRLGYKPPMPKAGSYRSALGARQALKAAGFDSLEAALDSLGLPRIAPAAAVAGDILGLPADDGGDWVGLSVALGNGRALAFQGGRCRIGEPKYPEGVKVLCWRVDPCPR